MLAWPRDGDIATAHKKLQELLATAGNDTSENQFAKVDGVGEPTTYNSFWNHGKQREVIPITAKRPYWIPDISDELFFKHGFYTAEHDIPYTERASADLADQENWWMFDTAGKPNKLKVLTYDIETTKYGTISRDIPIDIIGWSDFEVSYQAKKDLDTESFDFQFLDLPTNWQDCEVQQSTASNLDEEIDHLAKFTKIASEYDIISGHNVLGFDNKQIDDRIRDFMKRDERQQILEPSTKQWFQKFTEVHSRPDRSFHFGSSQDICVWYPNTLDTFHAARKFFFFHDDFSLKGLAPWLGINVDNRVYLEPKDQALNDETLRYNKHDVQEQTGVTMTLLAQALPLCFTVNMPMHDLMLGGNTKMWDHMALIRARRTKTIMPATCRAQGVARGIQRILPRTPFPEREEIAKAMLSLPEDDARSAANKELLRVVKQGPEMPIWCEHPSVIVQPDVKGNKHGYAIVGGMTLKPDSDLKSHFMPWFHVVAADVGAMYPTILKAKNLTADTVRPAYIDEEPDDWIWLFELDDKFRNSGKYHVREADPEKDRYTKGRGYIIGVKQNQTDGLVNKAMTGVLDMIQKVKDGRAEAKKNGEDARLWDMTYASLKAARNAGTHGILVAVNVSCRQFNVWGGANITTIGQRILHGTLEDFEAQGIRVVYGDTDGIYLGCSKSAGNLPVFADALGADIDSDADKWITLPDKAIAAVDEANKRWRDSLNYDGFELEAELHDAMVFVVHKNYLIFDAKDGEIKMETKGNNFKGSDKAPLAQLLLRDIMTLALREVASWDDEQTGREAMQTAIKRATRDVMKDVQVTEKQWDQLVLRQNVSPVKKYEPNPDGTLRVQAVRTVALEQVIGETINASQKFKFIVCREPLPLYKDPKAQEEARERLLRQGHQLVVKPPSKKGLKPIEHMWPVEHVQPHMVDWVWYKEMVENYVKGAFGFDSLELAVQRDLSSWF